MIFHLLTIFPEILDSYLDESILKRAQDKGIISLVRHNLRDWTTDKHRSVDDAPYGGGSGMLMRIEPLYQAIRDIKAASKKADSRTRKVVLLSAAGKPWNQALARRYSKLDEVILICGRYEGVDARVRKFIDAEISIGNYVLTGGELPALVMIDSITRLLPGVLGNSQSLDEESHSVAGLTEYPQYTRPEIFQAAGHNYRVPKVLLSGNHEKIKAWRLSKMRPSKI